MGWARLPIDVRGPFGLLGVGLIAGAAGLTLVASNGEEAQNTVNDMPRYAANQPDPDSGPQPDIGAMPAFDPPPGRPSPVIDPEPAPLPSEPPEDERLPVPQVSIQQDGAGGVLPARAGAAEVVFIVRLKGAPEVNVITRNFKRDPAAAQAAWTDLTARIPALADFDLVGASYSGEMRLAKRMPEATATSIKAAQDGLLAIDGVAYADPDYIAHPGQKDTQ